MTDVNTGRPTALITGGTRGIGLGIARRLAGAGWDLVLAGLRPAADVTPVLQELTTAGARVHYCAADVGRTQDRDQLAAEARQQFGGLNALINNAGRAPRVRTDLLEATEASFEEVLRTNLQGPYFLTQALVPLLLARRAAAPASPSAVVFVTSVSATMVSTNRGEYCISKAGLAMAVQLYAVRLAADRIPVYEVRPGIIATDMTAGVKQIYDQRIADGLVPDRRWGTPDDVGRVVEALVSGQLPYATGSVIHVDGGLTVPRL